MRISASVATAILLALWVSPAGAQEPAPGADSSRQAVVLEASVVEVVLTDGSVLYGRVLESGDGMLRLALLSGDVIVLRRDRIRDVRPLRGNLVDGEVWKPDPNATRLFFAPTGRSLEAGAGYFSVYELFVPFLAIGVTDGFTISGGTPLVFGDGERVFWIGPKLRIVGRDRFNAAVGVLHLFAPGSADASAGGGIAYAVATAGSRDRSATFGLGFGYSGDDLADRPVLMVGGEARTSRMVKVITENYVFPGEGALASAGLRFFGERLSADLGLVTPLFGSDEVIMLPLVNFVYNW